MEERSLILKWKEVVGPEIAAHSRAVDIQNGELIIDAASGLAKTTIINVPTAISAANNWTLRVPNAFACR